MKSMWNVHLLIPVSLLSPLLELVEERDGVVVKAVMTNEKAPPPKRMHYTNGKRNKGIKASDLILNTLVAVSSNRVKRPVLEGLFAQHGFSPNSLSPALCELKNQGRIEFNRGEVWTTIHGATGAP